MKNERVIKAQFHIGEQLGSQVKGSVAESQGYKMEMWPMGLLITAPGVRKVVTYNNIRGFDLDLDAPKEADKQASPLKK